jgi:hypothetical protein
MAGDLRPGIYRVTVNATDRHGSGPARSTLVTIPAR